MPLSSTLRLLGLALVVLTLAPPIRAEDGDTPAPAAPNPFFFHDGDTPAVFLGDSITEQRMYSTLIETYTLTRFPNWKITFRNVGWGGDTAGLSKRGGIQAGLDRDVIALKPKAVLIDFGMNDARIGDSGYTSYLKNSTKLVETLANAGVRVALVTSSPEERYQDNNPAGSDYNPMLQRYSDGLKIVADNEKVPFVDQCNPLVKFIEAGRQAGVLTPTMQPGDLNVVRLIPDGVHPNWGGHFIMASIILQGLHAPSMVSSVTIDATAHSITAAEGCTVEWQDVAGGVVQFKRTDNAIPWPVPGLSPEAQAQIDTALKIPGFDPGTTLNRYEVKVTGLAEPVYSLTIDNHEMGVFSAADLTKGVNLGFIHHGPLFEQGQQVLQAVIAKNDAYFSRWRNLQLYPVPDWLAPVPGVEGARQAEIKRLDGLVADAEKAIELSRKPVPHIFKLTPVKVMP